MLHLTSIAYYFPESNLPLSPFTVYLNVTDLTSYKVGWDTFCIRWSAHRSATSYRLKLNPADGKCIPFFAYSGNIIVLFQSQHHLFEVVASLPQKPWCICLSFKALNITCFPEWWKEGVLLVAKLTFIGGNPLVTWISHVHWNVVTLQYVPGCIITT